MSSFREELGPMLRLAGPVVLGELGWMAMGTVDTVMCGRVGREAIGAVAVGSNLFNVFAMFGMGVLLGLDTLVARSFGAGRHEDCDHSLRQGVWLSLLLTPPLMLLILATGPAMTWIGVAPDVRVAARPYVAAVSWGVLPLLLYAAFRRYLQAVNLVQPVMFALVSANLVNALVNWALIFGNLGAPRLGAEGAGWATTISRAYMALVLIGYTLWKRSAAMRGSWRMDGARIRELVSLGWPAAMQIQLEVGLFSLATVLAGKLGALAVSAHQVALNTCGITFMVPLGISSAAAVRVGQAAGRADGRGARSAGWVAIGLAVAFMSITGLTFFTIPHLVLSAYTDHAHVLALGTTLLWIGAFFQIFDGVQVTATGALRGLGDTRVPMLANLAGHWFIGLPAAWFLCFAMGWGVTGLWVGLAAGLVSVAVVLLWWWHRSIEQIGWCRERGSNPHVQ